MTKPFFYSNFFIKYKQIIPYLFVFIVIVLTQSCTAPKNTTYFNKLVRDTVIQTNLIKFPEVEIQKNDLLGISVSSLNTELDDKFNKTTIIKSGSQFGDGFLVNENGSINIHFLGFVQVEGLTRNQLREKLEKELTPFLKEPIVTVQFLNKKVTVMGEVKAPQVVMLTEEYTPLIDVLVKCGDLGKDAFVNDVIVIRDSINFKQVKHLNLEDHTLLSSSWYYVKPNDVVYVKSDLSRTYKEERLRSIQILASLGVSVFSLIIIILNALIK
jgi:polysaccharide export outer membrane protein